MPAASTRPAWMALALLVSACSATAAPPTTGAATAVGTTAREATTGADAVETPSTSSPPTTAAPDRSRHAGRRGFVPLDDPVMIAAGEATWLGPSDVVLGVVPEEGRPEAFPVRQMAYHHIANTTVAGEPYLVTY